VGNYERDGLIVYKGVPDVGRDAGTLVFDSFVSLFKMDLVAQYKDELIPKQVEIGECEDLIWGVTEKGIDMDIKRTRHSILSFNLERQRYRRRLARPSSTVQPRGIRWAQDHRHYGLANGKPCQLDIYFPSSSPSGKAPILFFVYGGGFTSGARQLPAPRQLVYANNGAFFAQRGYVPTISPEEISLKDCCRIVTVIPDYRLLPDMKFPDPLVDIKDALAFVLDNAAQINSGSSVQADTNAIFVMGHSAGASIVFSTFLYPSLLPASVKQHVRGLIVKGGPFHFHTSTPSIAHAVPLAYYGSDDAITQNEPLGLLQMASEEDVRALPELYISVSEYDLPALKECTDDVVKLLRERTGKEVGVNIMKGHTHVSPHIALYSGQGEEWAEEIVEWVKARA
jgi:pimeloyl-ACP methyl ester carboxylesterase